VPQGVSAGSPRHWRVTIPAQGGPLTRVLRVRTLPRSIAGSNRYLAVTEKVRQGDSRWLAACRPRKPNAAQGVLCGGPEGGRACGIGRCRIHRSGAN
jgi:hypothetical protein